jgi:HNH endonuclease
MRYLIPGSHGIYVSLNGDFYTEDGVVCELPVFKTTDCDAVIIEMFGKEHQVGRVWLKHLAIFGIDDPDCFNYVEFVDIPQKRIGYPHQVIFTKVKWHNNQKRYRIVPGFTTVAVDKNGNCITVVNGKLLDLKVYDGYYGASIYDPRAQRKRPIQIHRLVALAWITNKFPDYTIIVNHLDGNKKNNSYKNLEWTTYQGNSVHAVNHGLRKRIDPCKARDIQTGEVHDFPSIASLREFLGMPDSKLKIMFRSIRANKLYKDKYEIRVGEDDVRPWVYTDPSIMNIEASRYMITVIDNGVVYKFNGPRSLVKHYKLWNTGVNGIKSNIKALKERRPDLSITVTDQYDTRPIQIKSIKTNEVTVFPTVTSVVEFLNTRKSTTSYAVRQNGTKELAGYLMRYESNDPWPEEATANRFLSRRIEIVNRETGQSQSFDSLRQTASALNMDRNAVLRHISRPKDRDLWLMKEVNDKLSSARLSSNTQLNSPELLESP